MKWGHAVRVRKGTILYAAGVLACGNVLLQVLGFVYRVVLSRFAGAEGLGVYRLVNSVYLVLNAGCLSGVTTACSRLSAACEARGESGRLGAVLRLAFRAFFALSAACAAVVLLCGGSIAANLLGDGRCARAFPYMLLCLTLTGVENIFKSLFIGLERVQYTACSEVGEQLIRIFAVSFLLYESGSGDYGRIAMLIFAGMVCSEIFSALFLTRLFRRNMRHIRFTRPDKELYGQFFGIAAPLSASALIGNMLGSAGAVLLPQRLMAAGLDYEQALSALGVISGMAMPLLLFPVAFVSSVCTALLPAVTAAQAVGEQARVRVLTGRAVTTVGLIGMPATAVLVPLAPQLSEMFFPPATHRRLRRAARRGSRGGLLPDGDRQPAQCARSAKVERGNRYLCGAVPACVAVPLVCKANARHLRLPAGHVFDRSERRCGQPCHPAPANSVPPETLPAVRRAAALRRCSLPVDSLFRADICLPV